MMIKEWKKKKKKKKMLKGAYKY